MISALVSRCLPFNSSHPSSHEKPSTASKPPPVKSEISPKTDQEGSINNNNANNQTNNNNNGNANGGGDARLPSDPLALLGMIESQNQPDFEDHPEAQPVSDSPVL